MAGEFDRLTESDKMRSFVDTSKFREQLAESNSKIFDTELKSLQIDEARMDINEKSKLYASNDVDRQDKLKQRQYNIDFADFSKNAKTTDEINKAGQDFISKNPGSSFWIKEAVNKQIKEASGALVTKGQEIDLERAKAIKDASIAHEKAKIEYETLTQRQQQDDRRIKLSIDAGNAQDAIDVTNIDLPQVYNEIAASEASAVRNPKIPQEERIILANEYNRNYGHISKSVKIAQQATNEFLRIHGRDLFLAMQNPDLAQIARVSDKDTPSGNSVEFLDRLVGYQLGDKLLADHFFDKLIEDNSNDPDKLEQIFAMQQDFDELADLREPIKQLNQKDLEIKEKKEKGESISDSDRNELLTIGRRFSNNADTYVNSRKLKVDRTKEDLKNKNIETNINYKEKQSEFATRKLRLNQLNAEATQKAQAWKTIVRANAEKDKLSTLKEDDMRSEEIAKQAWDKAMSAVEEYELTPTSPDSSVPDDTVIPDTDTLE
jgi:hypothetical protein